MYATPRARRVMQPVPALDRSRSDASSTSSKNVILIGVFAALLVAPWQVALLVAPWQVALLALVAAPPAAYATRRFTQRSFERLPTHPALLSFFVASAATVAAAMLSFLVEPVRTLGVLLVLQLAVMPVAVAALAMLPRSPDVVESLRRGIVVGAIAAGAVAIVQVPILGLPRAEGGTTNAIVFGNLALLLALLAVALHRPSDSERATDPMTSLAAVGGLIAAVMSGTRSTAVAAPLLFAIVIWGRRDLWRSIRLSRVASGAALAVAAGVIFSRGVPTERLRLAVSDTSNYVGSAPSDPVAGTSIGARIEAWRAAAWAFRHDPLTGVGWGNLPSSFHEQVAAGQRNPRIATFDHAHNQLLSSLANGGVLGGLTLVAILAVPAMWFLRAARSDDHADRRLGTAGLTVVAGYAVFSTTEAIFENFVPVAFYAVVVAALLSQLRASARRRTGYDELDRDSSRRSTNARQVDRSHAMMRRRRPRPNGARGVLSGLGTTFSRSRHRAVAGARVPT